MEDRIRKIRRDFDLTQQQFSEKLKVSRNNVAGYEAGTRKPSDAVISLICREFNVSEEWLKDGIGEPYIQVNREDQLMEWAGRVLSEEPSSFRKRFVTMLSKLSEKDWEVLEKMALAFVEEEKPDNQ